MTLLLPLGWIYVAYWWMSDVNYEILKLQSFHPDAIFQLGWIYVAYWWMSNVEVWNIFKLQSFHPDVIIKPNLGLDVPNFMSDNEEIVSINFETIIIANLFLCGKTVFLILFIPNDEICFSIKAQVFKCMAFLVVKIWKW